jgi:hypothetical protein
MLLQIALLVSVAMYLSRRTLNSPTTVPETNGGMDYKPEDAVDQPDGTGNDLLPAKNYNDKYKALGWM